MCLLFQRQDVTQMETIWDGRAGQYVNEDLRCTAQRFPPRQPDADERGGRHEPRGMKAADRVPRHVQREQRNARGLCRNCPTPLEDDRFTNCRSCRIKNAQAQLVIERRRVDRGRGARSVNSSRVLSDPHGQTGIQE